MDLESRSPFLPFLIGVSVIAISATGYFFLLKTPPTTRKNTDVLSKSISATNTPPPEKKLLKTVDLPATDYPNSNFLSATAIYTQIPASAPTDCEKFDPTNATGPVETKIINGDTATFQPSGTVEDTTITDTRQYHIYKSGQCIEKSYTLKTTNILSIKPNENIKDVDHNQIWTRLESIEL